MHYGMCSPIAFNDPTGLRAESKRGRNKDTDGGILKWLREFLHKCFPDLMGNFDLKTIPTVNIDVTFSYGKDPSTTINIGNKKLKASRLADGLDNRLTETINSLTTVNGLKEMGNGLVQTALSLDPNSSPASQILRQQMIDQAKEYMDNVKYMSDDELAHDLGYAGGMAIEGFLVSRGASTVSSGTQTIRNIVTSQRPVRVVESIGKTHTVSLSVISWSMSLEMLLVHSII